MLVAFDYSPGSAGEMGTLAAPLLTHLMERQAQLVFVSTSQTGPELAQNVTSSLAQTAGYVYGEDYINLGYLPGGASGLRSFAGAPWSLISGSDFLSYSKDPQSLPVAAGITNSLEQVDLILILTTERDDLQAWIEQVGQVSGVEAPLAAGVSASLELWAQPYYTSEPRQIGWPGQRRSRGGAIRTRPHREWGRTNGQPVHQSDPGAGCHYCAHLCRFVVERSGRAHQQETG